jgi:hypothetical protein
MPAPHEGDESPAAPISVLTSVANLGSVGAAGRSAPAIAAGGDVARRGRAEAPRRLVSQLIGDSESPPIGDSDTGDSESLPIGDSDGGANGGCVGAEGPR